MNPVRKLIRLAAVLILCAGLGISVKPVVQGVYTEYETEKAAEQFYSQVEYEAAKPPEAMAYEDLFRAIENYNKELFATGQTALSGKEAYEAAAFRLMDFGLADEVIGVISIPAMEVELPLYLGANEENMANGAAIMGQTSIPIGGVNCNAVIAGHRGWCGFKYFQDIELLQAGDEVIITNLWETLRYKVTEIQIIDPRQVEAIHIQEGRDMVTLLTCHPYASGGKYRYLVICERS